MGTNQNQGKGQGQTPKSSPSTQKGTAGGSQKASQTNRSSTGQHDMKKPANTDRKSTSKWSDEDQDEDSNR